MKKIAIIGAGAVGSIAAFYLSEAGVQVDVYDDGVGQATKAAVGIICPWVSQRRNKEWYQLVETGAAFYHQLVEDLGSSRFYTQSGALMVHNNPEKLLKLAQSRTDAIEQMGDVRIISGKALNDLTMDGVTLEEALFIPGAACIDGAVMVDTALEKAKTNGANVIQGKVFLDPVDTHKVNGVHYDGVIVAAGAWINEVFKDYDFAFDVYAQKGQLIEFKDMFDPAQKQFPYIIPQGELDIMFDLNGSIIVGASHENEKGFDLAEDKAVLNRLYEESIAFLPFLADRDDYTSRVGTRAHSSDFNPFYGETPQLPSIYVASALGSSGLTSGPIIGYRLAQAIINGKEVEGTSKVENYIITKG